MPSWVPVNVNRKLFAFSAAGIVALAGACGGGPTGTPGPEAAVATVLLDLETFGVLPELNRSMSVAGPDDNENGVRDDIEAYVESLSDEPSQKAALLQASRVIRTAMIIGEQDETSDELRRSNAEEIGDAVNCIWTRYSDDVANDKVASIRRVTANTHERFVAYDRYNRMVSGSSFRLPTGDTCAIP